MPGPSASLKCIDCGVLLPPDPRVYACNRCGGLLDVQLSWDSVPALSWGLFLSRPRGVWRYRELLPADPSLAVSLGEGGTPLLESPRLARWVGVSRLYLKYEGANPTGSFKDRGMTVGVTKALEAGARMVCCASTGNTSASMAAYAARAGLDAVVFLPRHGVALGKLAQAALHGARLVEVDGGFDQALRAVVEVCRRAPIYLLNSVNPWRLEGQKTGAYELAEELREGFDLLALPVGNCGNIAAYWKGFSELHEAGLIRWRPRLLGVQAEGAAPLVQMLRSGSDTLVPVREPRSIATAIRIGHPASWKKARRAILESRGSAVAVSDREILEAQWAIARLAGLGVEPAGAASVAGLRRSVELGETGADTTAVAVLTGHALKDPDAAQMAPLSRITLEAFLRELPAR